MYKHPTTSDEEYPKTPREILNSSLDQVVKKFSERTITLDEPITAPVYSWAGAGSERGGSTEYIAYSRLVFLPTEEEQVVAVSVGNREIYKPCYNPSYGFVFSDHYGAQPKDQGYSVLLRAGVPRLFAEKLIESYKESKSAKSEELNSFRFPPSLSAFYRLVESSTRRYAGLELFAFDRKEESNRFGENGAEGFFVKAGYLSEDYRLLLPVLSEKLIINDVEYKKSLAEFLAEFAQGKGHASTYMTERLKEAQKRIGKREKIFCY